MSGHFSNLKKTLRIYKNNFLIYIFISFVFFLAYSPIILSGKSFSLKSLTITDIKNFLGTIIIFVAVGNIIQFINILALNKFTNSVLNNKRLNILSVYKYAISNVLPFFVSSMIRFFVLIPLFALLFVPGLIFMLLFSFFPAIFVDKKLKGFKALVLSVEIVKKNIDKVLVGYIFYYLIYISLTVVISLFTQIVLRVSENVNSIISFIFIFFTLPLASIYYMVLYKSVENQELLDKKSKKETIAYLILMIVGIVILTAATYFGIKVVSNILNFFGNDFQLFFPQTDFT